MAVLNVDGRHNLTGVPPKTSSFFQYYMKIWGKMFLMDTLAKI